MLKVSRGFPYPFGTSKHKKGINFALFSKHALKVTLCLFDENNKEIPLILNPQMNKTGDVWHLFIDDLPENTRYGYRLEGLYDPFLGLYYDPKILLLDPYCKLVDTPNKWGKTPTNTLPKLKGIAAPLKPFDWENDQQPNIPANDLIIYEMHVRGFTQDPSSNVQHKGTFLGLIEKIPYLKSLGINAVELMPIHEFHEGQSSFTNPKTKKRLYQYWGYQTINFFSPMNRYGTGQENTINEFKTLVKELHKNGIEVILDVVYNHTAEGDENGPIFSFKGLENPTYYMLGPNGEYYNFTGCGNTINGNHPVVRELIKESLRYWVVEMHVDGFRFDLASILTRDHDGRPNARPPVLEMIACDPILSKTKLIAEAWDAAGLYQVGSFPSFGVFSEWNGAYRDGVRRFIKGTDGSIGPFATRLTGSEDLYGKGRTPAHSINYVTCHDGFTLRDLVSYNQKHNEENGEENRDGINENESWNCGVEGETKDEKILFLREKQMRNFHLALLVSEGVPMLSMGDEYGHTKLGNNNSWGHDSRLNWFQWDTLEKTPDFFRFYQALIAFRNKHPILRLSHFLGEKDITWHGIELGKPDWSSKNRFLAFSLPDNKNKYELFIAFNAHFSDVTFALPNYPWKCLFNTSNKPPEDFIPEESSPTISSDKFTLPSYSSLILKRHL